MPLEPMPLKITSLIRNNCLLEFFAIAVGGALGAVSRYSLGNLVNHLFGTDYPYSILLVNVLGSFLMGICFELLVEAPIFPAVWRSFLMVGFLGAFTTFSTFSMQVLGLFESGRMLAALSYVLLSVTLSIIAVAIGIFICRELTT